MTFQLTVPGTDIELIELEGRLVGGGALFEAAVFGATVTDLSPVGSTAGGVSASVATPASDLSSSGSGSNSSSSSGSAQSDSAQSDCADPPRIWDLLRAERRLALDTFAQDYAAVRRAEQRALSPAEVRALPAVLADNPLAAMWHQRARSHARFKGALGAKPAGCALDIGAGCGWLAADLARNGWQACALDVMVHGADGLAAARHHEQDLLLVRAEMEALPFASASVDLAVFNASLHYASDVAAALAEACRVLRPGGILAVLDSPIFKDPAAGNLMVQEFAAHTRRAFDLAPASHQGPGFVTEADVAGYGFSRIEAVAGLRKRVHDWRGARLAGRETAARPLLIATIGGTP